MANKFYITTPLYYVNASPHIGHSYTNIAADVLARYYRKEGFDVYLLTGTDEHGQKIQRAAEEEKLKPPDFTDMMVEKFKQLWRRLDITYNDFIRTTEERHKKGVQYALELLFKKQDIYKGTYQGWYCVPCETFWQETDIALESPGGRVCPDCHRPLENIEEENYFFSLTKYQDWLVGYIKGHPDFIKPPERYNEVLSFLAHRRLSDLCISRPKVRLSWGIPFSFDMDYVVYVWFDALLNYITAVGFGWDKSKFSRYWPADIHLVGKDILRQHAIYWPIMLHALGLELPRMIFAHGWWMVGEDKMSKSKGNIIDPLQVVDGFGVDTYRYFLLRDVPFGLDGNFSQEAIIRRFNSDLANDLGNLVYRTLTMVEKYFDGNIPHPASLISNELAAALEDLSEGLNKSMRNLEFSIALDKIWELINRANKYIEQTKPWILARQNQQEELKGFIYLLIKVLRIVAEVLAPFMPHTAESIIQQIGKDKIKKGKPLFPRIQ